MAKRGESYSSGELWLLVAAFLLASFAGIGLLQDVSDRIEGTLLEKNYIASDLAMTLEALVAAPGEIAYTYNLGMYEFFIDVDSNKVSVKESPSETSAVTYRIVWIGERDSAFETTANPDGLKVSMPEYKTVKLAGEDCPKPKKLVLSKSFGGDGSSKIAIEGRNMVICAENDEACQKLVVECE